MHVSDSLFVSLTFVLSLVAVAKKPEKPQKKVLIQLKGKNRIHVRQVELSSKTLNKADVFILDLGDRVITTTSSLCYHHFIIIICFCLYI